MAQSRAALCAFYLEPTTPDKTFGGDQICTMTRLAAFSLVEVLVAFTLLTTALVIVVPELANPAAQIGQRTAKAYAMDYAYSRVARYGTTVPITAGFRDGEELGWLWQDNVSLKTLHGVNAEVFKIEVSIFDRNGRIELATVTGYR